MVGIVLIHRNIRLHDNHTLNKALQENDQVACVFIGTPEQLDAGKNPYHNNTSIQFMVESLTEMDRELQQHGARLNIFYGEYMDVLKNLLTLFPGSKIYLAHDFTPYAKRREQNIKSLTTDVSVIVDDLIIFDMSDVLTQKGTPYKTFKPFYEKIQAKCQNVEAHISTVNFGEKLIAFDLEGIMQTYTVEEFAQVYVPNPQVSVHGGRSGALQILSQTQKFQNYGANRDTPAIDTTWLSAYIKFGCVSMREVAKWAKDNYGINSELLRQIIWHDFFANLMEHATANQTIGGGNFQNKSVQWQYNDQLLTAWKNGRTGFPLADAGMRQLNTIGWMHNRVRMVVVGILCHMFLLDWHEGEKYFAQKLVDYDVSSNNGNWQATAGVGYDYRWRIFNPFTQSTKHDPMCDYIKKWVPELKNVPNGDIHNWNTQYAKYPSINYPGPLVDYEQQRRQAERFLR